MGYVIRSKSHRWSQSTIIVDNRHNCGHETHDAHNRFSGETLYDFLFLFFPFFLRIMCIITQNLTIFKPRTSSHEYNITECACSWKDKLLPNIVRQNKRKLDCLNERWKYSSWLSVSRCFMCTMLLSEISIYFCKDISADISMLHKIIRCGGVRICLM